VLGMASTFGGAFYKAEEAAAPALPTAGTVLFSVARREKEASLRAAKKFHELGFRIRATKGTHDFLSKNGVPAELIMKLNEGRPNIADAVTNGELQLIINTPAGREAQTDDSYIRKAAIKYRIPYMTTAAAAWAAAQGIEEARHGRARVKSLQEYHAELG